MNCFYKLCLPPQWSRLFKFQELKNNKIEEDLDRGLSGHGHGLLGSHGSGIGHGSSLGGHGASLGSHGLSGPSSLSSFAESLGQSSLRWFHCRHCKSFNCFGINFNYSSMICFHLVPVYQFWFKSIVCSQIVRRTYIIFIATCFYENVLWHMNFHWGFEMSYFDLYLAEFTDRK